MKTAVIQLNASDNKERNIERALRLVRRAAARKAEFILLPEAFNFRGKADPRRGFRDAAEDIPGPSTVPLMDLAKEKGAAILAGSICERVPGGTKTYNTSVLIDAKGRIAAKYRKIHLFDTLVGKIKVKESRYFCAGRKTAMARVGRWRAGLSICYDLRFPALYQGYAKAGADILCVPSAFTRLTGRAHWETLLRARAVENLCYVLAPNQTGKDGRGIADYGNSMIVDPWGKVLARASGDKEEIVFARLDRKLLAQRRGALPFCGSSQGLTEKHNR